MSEQERVCRDQVRGIEYAARLAKLPEKFPGIDRDQRRHDSIGLTQFIDGIGRRQRENLHPGRPGRSNTGLRVFDDKTLVGPQERPHEVVEPLQSQEIDGRIRLPDRTIVGRHDKFNGLFDHGPAKHPVNLLTTAAGGNGEPTQRSSGLHKLDHTGKQFRLLCGRMEPE